MLGLTEMVRLKLPPDVTLVLLSERVTPGGGGRGRERPMDIAEPEAILVLRGTVVEVPRLR